MHENGLIFKKVALFKIKMDSFLELPIFNEILKSKQAQLLEVGRNAVIMLKVGDEYEIENFYKMVRHHGLIQNAISSRVAIFSHY